MKQPGHNMQYNKFKEFMENNQEDNNQDDIEYQQKIDKCNEAIKDMSEMITALDITYMELDNAERVIKVLREDGIDPIALKILCSNKLYTDIWNIVLPSTESLKTDGNNQLVANHLADMLELKMKNAYSASSEGIVNKIKNLWDKFKDLFKSNEEKIESLYSKLVEIDIDDEKCKDKVIEAFDYTAMKNFEMLLDKLKASKDSISSKKYNEIRKIKSDISTLMHEGKTKIKINDIAKDMTSKNDKYYKIVNNLKESEYVIKKWSTTYVNTQPGIIVPIKISEAIDCVSIMQKNYIQLASTVLACKKQ